MYPLIIIGTAFIVLEAVLYLRRAALLRDANEQLHAAKREVQDIAKLPLNNPYPLLQINSSGRILFCNSAALQAFKNIEAEGTSHPALAGLSINSGDQSERQAFTREIEYDEVEYLQTIFPTLVDSELSWIIYCYDITKQKDNERKLIKAREASEYSRRSAEHANQARGTFLANMSHELRTPMNGIIGLSDLLKKSKLDPEDSKMVHTLNSAARNLLTVLNDILDFSKIEAGELTIEQITFNICEIIEQISSLHSTVANKKSLKMSCNIEDNVPKYVLGDPARLQQILNNIIGNAIKFTNEGSIQINVSASPVAGKHKTRTHIFAISVKDTGIGIPQEKHASIFNKFQQVDESTSRLYGGTGLGLSITKDLVKLFGGTITLKSAVGKGTVFTVNIPFEKVDQIEAGMSDDAAASVQFDSSSKILVVDDHPINLMYLSKLLNSFGFPLITEAENGLQAVELCKQEKFDIIFMDCQMPKLDGFETTKLIHKNNPDGDVPIIIAVTANAMKGVKEKCMSYGMNDYISKPIDSDKLHSALLKWLPTKRIQEAAIENSPERPSVEKKEDGANAHSEINWDVIKQFSDDDAEKEKEIIEIFFQTTNDDLSKLKSSIEAGSMEEWVYATHKMYGACSLIGAEYLAELCDKAQHLTDWDDKVMNGLYNDIVSKYKDVREALEQH